jgi:hypothetical protein
MKKSLVSLTKNKYVFYVVSLLAILNVLGYFSMRSWNCIVMFAAVAYATKCYAKNNVIALLAGLFVANFVFGCNQVKENFEEAMNPGAAAVDAVDQLKETLDKKCKDDEELGKDGVCVAKGQDAKAGADAAADVLDKVVSNMKGMEGMGSVMDALKNMGQ